MLRHQEIRIKNQLGKNDSPKGFSLHWMFIFYLFLDYRLNRDTMDAERLVEVRTYLKYAWQNIIVPII